MRAEAPGRGYGVGRLPAGEGAAQGVEEVAFLAGHRSGFSLELRRQPLQGVICGAPAGRAHAFLSSVQRGAFQGGAGTDRRHSIGHKFRITLKLESELR